MPSRVPKGHYSQLEPPLICYWCDDDNTTLDHYVKNYNKKNTNGFSWLCRDKKNRRNNDYYKQTIIAEDSTKRDTRRLYNKLRYEKHHLYIKWKAYSSCDQKMYGGQTVPWSVACYLMIESCFYCDKPTANGLDRKDSNLGHSEENVVPCCHKCNTILGDIPWEAKLCLKDGLEQIQRTQVLNDWVPPTMRRKKSDV